MHARYENGPTTSRPPPGFGGTFMEIGDSDVGKNRRVLRDIKNVVNAPHYPSVTGKRRFPGKDVADGKNPPACISRRPITRSFTASLKLRFCSQVPCHHAKEEMKDSGGNESNLSLVQVPLSTNGLDASTAALHMEEHKVISDLDLPMNEELEEAVCELKEVVMVDDVEEELLVDIDSQDINDPLLVVEYVDDIYKVYRKMEDSACVSPSYMSNQFDLNEKMRAILIDWLIEVHYKFELMDETLFLTVNIIDRFLARQSMIRKKLQLVGITAMLLACKYEEVSVPVVEDLILISDRAYSRSEVLEMERLILNTLHFNMSVPTPYAFIRRCLRASESDEKVELLSFYIIELCLVEYEMLEFRPSLLAAAAVYTAQCAINGFKHWTKMSEVHSHYSEEQLLECSRKMVDFHRRAGMGKLTAVHRKFSTLKFGCAAKFEPAFCLLDTRME